MILVKMQQYSFVENGRLKQIEVSSQFSLLADVKQNFDNNLDKIIHIQYILPKEIFINKQDSKNNKKIIFRKGVRYIKYHEGYCSEINTSNRDYSPCCAISRKIIKDIS